MGLNHSPKIVTNGLVFAYDMVNTNKSWKGAPTTNRVPNATAFTDWINYYRTIAKTSFTTEFGTTGWRFIDQPSWSGIRIGYTVPSTGTYTFSAYYKYLSGSASNNGGTVYISGWGGNDVAASVNKSLVGVWQRVQITLNLTNVSGTFYLISFGGTDNGTTSPDYTSFEVTMPMIESGSFATPFVDGTRSNTQALTDLTLNNTITLDSVTYNADGSFEFDGINNYASFGNASALNSIGGTSNIAVEAWVNYDTYLGNNGAQGYSVVTHKGYPWTWLMENPGATGRIRFVIGGSDVSCTDTETHPLSTWMQWIGTYDGSNMKFYRNGVLKRTTAATGVLGTNNGAAIIGEYAGSYRMNGKISAIRVYNRALTESEVLQNFNATRGRYGL